LTLWHQDGQLYCFSKISVFGLRDSFDSQTKYPFRVAPYLADGHLLQVAQQKDFPLIDHENILPQNNEGLL
jgi:hypothetical protein